MAKLGDVILRDALASRPAAGIEGRLFYDTTNSILYRDSGTDWEAIEAATAEATRGIAFYLDGDQTVASRLAAIVVPLSLAITEVRILVGTAPVGADLIVDVNKNGTTIFTTQGNRPTIADGNTADTSGTPDVTALAVGDVLSIDVDQIGSGTSGSDLSVTVICEEA